MRLLAIIFALLSVSCGGFGGRNTIDWRGSPEGFVLATEAAAEWSDLCGVEIVVERGNFLGIPAYEVHGPVSYPKTGTYNKAGITFFDRYGNANLVVVDSSQNEETRRAVLAHEFGHILWLNHSHHDQDGLMAVTISGTERVELRHCHDFAFPVDDVTTNL